MLEMVYQTIRAEADRMGKFFIFFAPISFVLFRCVLSERGYQQRDIFGLHIKIMGEVLCCIEVRQKDTKICIYTV
jgi:hypothetical protein